MAQCLDQNPALASRLASLARRLDLGSALRGLDEGLGDLAAAPETLKELRKGGWAWFKGLEAEIGELQRALPATRQRAVQTRDQLTAPLRARLKQLQALAGRPGDAAALAALNQSLFRLDQDLVMAERSLEGTIVAPVERARALRDRLRQGQRALDRFADAGFRLPSGERPWLAFDVRWVDAPGAAEPPPGVLLLSDARLRFERRDDRVLRRNLGGLAVETKVDRTVLVDEPHGSLGGVRDASAGVVVREARAALLWRAGALAGKTCTFASDQGVAELCAAAEAVRTGRVGAYA